MQTPTEPLNLPEIALSDLPESTKDFIIAASSFSGKSVKDVLRETLNASATDSGFPPSTPHNHQHAA